MFTLFLIFPFATTTLQMTELNALKKKAPADLWKDDLAAFLEELEVGAHLYYYYIFFYTGCVEDLPPNLRITPGHCEGYISSSPPPPQRVEAKEKEDAALPVKKTSKGKAVKMTVKSETLPTPQGRRVIPRITSAMKAEASKKADLLKGERKRGRNVKVCFLI